VNYIDVSSYEADKCLVVVYFFSGTPSWDIFI